MNRARPVQTVHHTDLHEGFWVQFPEIGGTKEIWIHHKMDAQSFGNRVYNSGFREYGARLRVQGSGLRVQGSGFRIECSGFRFQGSRFRGECVGFRVQAFKSELQRVRLIDFCITQL
jgi:hypothetical protein